MAKAVPAHGNHRQEARERRGSDEEKKSEGNPGPATELGGRRLAAGDEDEADEAEGELQGRSRSVELGRGHRKERGREEEERELKCDEGEAAEDGGRVRREEERFAEEVYDCGLN